MVFNPDNFCPTMYFTTTGVGKSATCELTFCNEDTETSPIYEVSMIKNLYFQPNKQKLSSLKPQCSETLCFKLGCYSSRTIEDIPSEIQFELLVNNSRVSLIAFDLHMYHFNGTLTGITLRNTEPLKLLLFGVQASGKSAFINSVVKMLRNDKTKYPASSGSGYGADTVTLQDYNLKDLGLSIIDTWGWTLHNYMNGEIEKIIKGTAPRGLPMDDNGSYRNNNEKIGKADCIICVVNYEIMQTPNQTWKQKMAEMVEQAKRQGVPVIFLITRLDELNAELSSNPNISSQEVKQLKQQVKQAFGVGEDRIDYVINYTTTQGVLDFEIDRRIFSVLYNALSKAAGTRLVSSTSSGPVFC